MRLTAWLASFHTNRAADILSRRLSHQPRPQLTSRRSGLSHQPQVSQCFLNWSYSRSQPSCFLNPAVVAAPDLKADPCRSDREPRFPAAMPLRVPSPQASHTLQLAVDCRSPDQVSREVHRSPRHGLIAGNATPARLSYSTPRSHNFLSCPQGCSLPMQQGAAGTRGDAPQVPAPFGRSSHSPLQMQQRQTLRPSSNRGSPYPA